MPAASSGIPTAGAAAGSANSCANVRPDSAAPAAHSANSTSTPAASAPSQRSRRSGSL